jgi:hypothetical protein
MIVLAESTGLLAPSASRRDLERSIEAAWLAGARVFFMPPDFSRCENAENALAHVASQKSPTPTVWIGFIPSFERYESIYGAVRAKNGCLLNTPDEHRAVQEFDLSYRFLEGLTPRSAVARSEEEAVALASEIGFPVFTKGALQSRKARGWEACVARDEAELRARVRELLDLSERSRGRVILRELVRLRHERSANGFPMGREFRAFVLDARVLGLGYYWEGDDALRALTPGESSEVQALAVEAARRLPARYVAIDIGQKESGEWTVIESGDAQFAGLSQMPALELWHRLKIALDSSTCLWRASAFSRPA